MSVWGNFLFRIRCAALRKNVVIGRGERWCLIVRFCVLGECGFVEQFA